MTECEWAFQSHKTLHAIVAASIELVDEAGSIDAVSVEEIAEAAGVSRRTFFNHVPSKMTALLLPLFEARATYIRHVIDAPEHLGPWEALEAGILATLDADLELAARSERILSTMVHKSAAGQMPDRSADEAHTHALEASLSARLGSNDPIAVALLVANGNHILRLALRALLEGKGPYAVVTHAFSLLHLR